LNTAHFRVLVPPDATVLFNNVPTRQTGPMRIFDTPSLQQGRNYNYEVAAKFHVNGQEVTRVKQIAFHAGDAITVDLR
jgi:uncharacterized protein (TIGR03000 family)